MGRVFSLSTQRVLGVAMVVMLASIIVAEMVLFQVRLEDRRAQELQTNLVQARSLATTFDGYIQSILHQELAMGLLATSQPPLSPEEVNGLLSRSVHDYPFIQGYSYLDPEGRVLASSVPLDLEGDLSGRPYLQAIFQGKEWVVGDLSEEGSGSGPTFAIALGIRDEAGALLGIVVASVDPTRLGQELKAGEMGEGAVAIVDSEDSVVYRYPEAGLSDGEMAVFPTAVASMEMGGGSASWTIDGRQVTMSQVPILSTGWVVRAISPADVGITPTVQESLAGLGMLVAVVGFGVLSILAMGRSLAVPMDQIKARALAIARGEPTRRLDVSGPTELRELADALDRMTEEVRAREEMREEYLNTISHDLRSSLTIIQGHAQMMQLAPDRVELVRKSVYAVISGVRRMNAMVQDLADAAHLDSGQLQVRQVPVDLRLFAFDLKERMTGYGESDRIRVEAPEGLPLVSADPNRLERVLLNLLTNALKYSDLSTPVTVTIVDGKGEVITSVADRGPGIAPEELPELFQRFRRTRHARDHCEGLGLGLYIAKGLLEAQGGRIWVESEMGNGSVFRFALPVITSGGGDDA